MEQVLRKIGAGEIRLPVAWMKASQNAAKVSYLDHLAEYVET